MQHATAGGEDCCGLACKTPTKARQHEPAQADFPNALARPAILLHCFGHWLPLRGRILAQQPWRIYHGHLYFPTTSQTYDDTYTRRASQRMAMATLRDCLNPATRANFNVQNHKMKQQKQLRNIHSPASLPMSLWPKPAWLQRLASTNGHQTCITIKHEICPLLQRSHVQSSTMTMLPHQCVWYHKSHAHQPSPKQGVAPSHIMNFANRLASKQQAHATLHRLVCANVAENISACKNKKELKWKETHSQRTNKMW